MGVLAVHTIAGSTLEILAGLVGLRVRLGLDRHVRFVAHVRLRTHVLLLARLHWLLA